MKPHERLAILRLAKGCGCLLTLIAGAVVLWMIWVYIHMMVDLA